MFALAVILAASAGSASAGPDPNWAARWEGQSDYLTMESGQVATSWMKARNVGAQTWNRSFVNFATVSDKAANDAQDSPFQIPGDWLTPNRPGRLDQDTVPPGGVGTFTFRVRAPVVSVKTDFYQHFTPVAEGISWMGCYDGCQWSSAWLVYTVYPPQDPTVAIADGPRTVTKGEPIDVTANASDNVAVNRVVFSLEDQQIVDTTAPYEAQFPTSGLEPGGHVVTVHAFDGAEHSATDVASYSVRAPTGDVGVSIDEGQTYTNDPNVRLTLHPPAGATGASIANDGLTGTTDIPLSGGAQVVPWRLATSGPERLPKTVYVHFTGNGVDPTDQHTDDIILDQTPPKVSGARVVVTRRGNRRLVAAKRGLVKDRCSAVHLALKVKASDNASHVRELVYKFSAKGKPTAMAYKANVPIKVPPKLSSPKAIFVAVQDGALNLSKVHKVSLRPVCR
jgi:hypothetical protein